MKLKIKFRSEGGKFSLPCNYNELVQGLIYSYLDKHLSENLHNEGFADPLTKRKFKFFTFSRIIPEDKPTIKDGKFFVKGSAILHISSSLDDFIHSFGNNLLKAEYFNLGNTKFSVESISVEPSPKYSEKVLVKVLSPITIYSTLKTPNGGKKTYYYNPFEREFNQLLIQNLEKKYRALFGEKIQGGYIKPYKVSTKNERIVIFKGTVIKGWDGIYELSLPRELFKLAFDTGLGDKNSQGFGCIDIWKREGYEY